MKTLAHFFSREEIKDFLTVRGFEIREETCKVPVLTHTDLNMGIPTTYNAVFKDGEPYKKDVHFLKLNPHLWMINVFEEQLKEKLLDAKESTEDLTVQVRQEAKPQRISLQFPGNCKKFEKESDRKQFACWLAGIICTSRIPNNPTAYTPNDNDSYFWSIDQLGNNFWILFDEENLDKFTLSTRYPIHAVILESLAKYLFHRLHLEEIS